MTVPPPVLDRLRRGTVIPAHPLALTEARALDEPHMRALTRYYMDAGAGGIAVGVHTTQFEIREPRHGLYDPVLELAAETVRSWRPEDAEPFVMIAGICGPTAQAVNEAATARDHGYHAGLLSLGALAEAPLADLVAHCRAVAEVLPVVGFYLQPSVGGRILPYEFWREFAEIDNVVAIKMAPFNRYQTFDVVRAVCEAGRDGDIALYTGNDDNIVLDLLTPYRIQTTRGPRTVRIVGGLLGHWSVWTRAAVQLLRDCHALVEAGGSVPPEMLLASVEVTDSNAVFFDVANGFAGCIPGLHAVLHRQGLMRGLWCLNPDEVLSSGQAEELDRVYAAYPHLNDDDFVRENLDRWLQP